MIVYVGAITLPVSVTLNVTELSTDTAAVTNNIDMSIALRGPIESVAASDNKFTILGQTVTNNASTDCLSE